TLEEGSILIGVSMAPSISLEKSTETIMKVEKQLTKYEEVKQTISRIGRPETGSHPHPVNYAEVHIELFPRTEWVGFKDKASLIESMEARLSKFPGIQLNFSQPIQNAFDELLSGTKTELAIKVFGEELEVLKEKATEIKNKIDKVEGLVDLSLEQSFGQPQLQVRVDRSACSRYGVNVSALLEKVEIAIGGESIDQVYLNTRRFDINLRYKEQFRKDPESIKNLIIKGGNGELLKLSQLAEVKNVTGPIQINREKNMRRWVIQANIRGRDLGGVVSDIKSIIRDSIEFPPGYYVEIGGQFENQERAMAKLKIIVPIAIILIFFLLYLTFGSLKNALLIILNIPLGLIGGIFGLLIFREYLSVPASIGFIALFGIAVQNGVVLVSYINRLIREGMDMDEAIIRGGIVRLRPVLMTALTTVLGLIPLLLSQGIGAEVQRPLAVVVVNGLISSTFLTLILIP
ncbi:MAG: efflux RND transporter permease subunit, partial [Candidatus Aminicenantes bacterium]|nr:efflux RND transporter permease subunit [Candidatus Aminicenantes bacterium]